MRTREHISLSGMVVWCCGLGGGNEACRAKGDPIDGGSDPGRGGAGTPYIRMIGMIVVFLRGCNRRFGIF